MVSRKTQVRLQVYVCEKVLWWVCTLPVMCENAAAYYVVYISGYARTPLLSFKKKNKY